MSNQTDALPQDPDVFPTADGFDDPAVQPALRDPRGNPEEIQRIRVDEEDRMAFRVGVNILTLVLIGVGAYLLWRRFFAGG